MVGGAGQQTHRHFRSGRLRGKRRIIRGMKRPVPTLCAAVLGLTCLAASAAGRPNVLFLAVVDLKTGKTLVRQRTHFGPRRPVIDRTHNLVYVTTTFGPSIWVFDRNSFEPLGRLPIGIGARNAHLTADDTSAKMYANGAEMELLYEAFAFDQVKTYRTTGTDTKDVADTVDYLLLDEGWVD